MKVSEELIKLVKSDNQLFQGYFQQMKLIVETKLEQKRTFDTSFNYFLEKLFKLGKNFTKAIHSLLVDFAP